MVCSLRTEVGAGESVLYDCGLEATLTHFIYFERNDPLPISDSPLIDNSATDNLDLKPPPNVVPSVLSKNDPVEPSDTERIAPLGKFTDKLIMLLAVLGPFVGCLVAIVLFWQNGWMGWTYLSLFVGIWILTGMGITIGFHRLLTHSSFETYRPIRALLMFFGALSVQGSPLVWCAVHRKHHHKSDLLGDPHSPQLHGTGLWNRLKGFWFAHSGWLFTGYWSYPEIEKYVPDLLKDKLLVFVDRMYYLWVILSLGIPTAIGGLTAMSWKGAFLGFLWGGLVRIFIGHHITWSINSVCHIFGSRTYRVQDFSTNNVICGFFAFGEGWHNNHHAFPTSARHGLAWWQFDLSWLIIKAMGTLHLAWNIRLPTEQMMSDKRLRRIPVSPER